MLDKTAVLESLKGQIGKRIVVDCVYYGRRNMESGTLREVSDVGVGFEKAFYPFVGYGCAILMITGEQGETLYNASYTRSVRRRSRGSVSTTLAKKVERPLSSIGD